MGSRSVARRRDVGIRDRESGDTPRFSGVYRVHSGIETTIQDASGATKRVRTFGRAVRSRVNWRRCDSSAGVSSTAIGDRREFHRVDAVTAGAAFSVRCRFRAGHRPVSRIGCCKRLYFGSVHSAERSMGWNRTGWAGRTSGGWEVSISSGAIRRAVKRGLDGRGISHDRAIRISIVTGMARGITRCPRRWCSQSRFGGSIEWWPGVAPRIDAACRSIRVAGAVETGNPFERCALDRWSAPRCSPFSHSAGVLRPDRSPLVGDATVGLPVDPAVSRLTRWVANPDCQSS
jgi:hypothetical protein